MSLPFHQFISQNNGILIVNLGSGALVDAIYDQGLACDETGAIYSTLDLPVDHYENGLPFDANDRLVIEDAPIAYYDQGLPFTANNAVAATGDPAIDHYNQGVPFSSSGAIVIEGVTPPVESKTYFSAVNTGTIEIVFWGGASPPWDRVTPIATIPSVPRTAAFGRDSFAIALGAPDYLALYDTTVEPWPQIPAPIVNTDSIVALGYDRTGNILATFQNISGNFAIYDVSDLGNIQVSALITDEGSSGYQSHSFNAENSILAYGKFQTTLPVLYLYDVTDPLNPIKLPDLPGQTSDSVYVCAFHPVYTQYLVAYFNTEAHFVYDVVAGTKLGNMNTPTNSIAGGDFSPDGNYYVGCYPNGFQVVDSSSSNWADWSRVSITAMGSSVRFGGWVDGNVCYINDLTLGLAVFWDLTDPVVPVDVSANYLNNQGGTPNIVSDFNSLADSSPPAQITDLVASSGEIEQSGLTWTAPVSALPILRYDIQLKATSSSQWLSFTGVSGDQTSQVIFALSAQSYDFRVAAVTSSGAGDWSNVVSATPIAISVPLVGWYKETGLSGSGATTQWLSEGTYGEWNLEGVIGGTPANLTLGTKKGKTFLNSAGGAALQNINFAGELVQQPYTHYYCIAPSFLDANKRLLGRDTIGAGVSDCSIASGVFSMYALTDLEVLATTPTDGTEIVICANFAAGPVSSLRAVLNDGATDATNTGNPGPNNFEMDTLLSDAAFTLNRDYIGDFYEFRVYSGSLTAAEEQAVLGAYQQKWWDGFPYIASEAPPE